MRTSIDIHKTSLNDSGDIQNISNSIDNNKKPLEQYKNIVDENAERFKDVDIDEKISSLQKDIMTKTSDLRVAITEKTNQTMLLNDYEKRRQSIQMQIDSLGSEEDVEKLNNEISVLNESLSEKQKMISNNPSSALVRQMLGERKDINRHVSQFVEFSDFIE